MRLIFIIFFLLCSNLVFAQQWRLAKGTEGFAAADIDIYYSNPDTMYAIGSFTNGDTTHHSGLLISTDRGESWGSIDNSPATDVGAIKVDPFDSKRIYVSVYGFDDESNDIWMTKDGGGTWTRLFGGRSYPAPVVEIDPVDLRTVYVGVGPGYIRRSTDRGETWDAVTTTPPGFFLNALTIAPSNDSILYAAYVSGLFKSTDKGVSWTQLPLDPGHWGIQCVVVDPYNPDTVYAAVFSRGLPPGGVFKSTDGGANWEEKNNGLDSTHWNIHAMAMNPNNPKQLFLGNGFPVYFFETTDAGNHWIKGDGGFYGGGVRPMVIDIAMKRLLVGAGSGIYINDSLLTSVQHTTIYPLEIHSLLQNYPNPFNGSTIIKYTLSRNTFVNLKLYDILGREIRVIVNGFKAQGSYEVKLEGGDLPSGIYLYRLTVGTQVLVRKAVLVK